MNKTESRCADLKRSYLPGEKKAIDCVKNFGRLYGYGNMIHHLKCAWSNHLRETYKFDQKQADLAAGHICVWCYTDTRTGEKIDKEET